MSFNERRSCLRVDDLEPLYPPTPVFGGNIIRGTTVSEMGLQIFGFRSICGSVDDMYWRLLGVDGLPHARQSVMLMI